MLCVHPRLDDSVHLSHLDYMQSAQRHQHQLALHCPAERRFLVDGGRPSSKPDISVPAPPTDLLSRLQNFLPAMQSANQQLQQTKQPEIDNTRYAQAQPDTLSCMLAGSALAPRNGLPAPSASTTVQLDGLSAPKQTAGAPPLLLLQ